VIGTATLVIACLAALAAWTARETYRTPLDELGAPDGSAKARSKSWAQRGTSA
jgi:hypothetical protein